jgi:hypothetical protein
MLFDGMLLFVTVSGVKMILNGFFIGAEKWSKAG